MKTAISLPDPVYRAAERLARRLKVSRSELYATAVAEYVAKHTTDEVTARLNAVYAAEPSVLDPALAEAQAKSLPSEEW